MDTDLNSANVLTDAARFIFSFLDLAAFNLLSLTYQIFFNVASADLFSNDLTLGFYRRIQLILGVFMIFQLALTILKGIVNPDSFFKNDKGGAGNLIVRIAISLIIFTVLIPINTPGNNEFQEKVNNNGLLFGTLYSLQHRILSNNTIGRLVLGTNDNSNFISPDGTQANSQEDLEKSSKIFTSTLFKVFYRINLKPVEDRTYHNDDGDDAIYNDNRICQDWDSDMLDSYTKIDADIGTISEMSKMKCEADASSFVDAFLKPITGKSYYYLAVMPFIPMVVALLFSFLLLSFSIDIAVRAFKLVILRIIAPIPIISYINPNGSGDTSFNTWAKSIASTYLDLFIRLASIYFAIYLINSMIISGVSLPVGGLIGAFSTIIIWVGLFVFAKQAPKFIKEAIGFKGDGGKIFGGFGDIAAVLSTAGAFGASALGMVGSGLASAKASKISDEVRGKNATSGVNRAKHLAAGILGGISGGVGAAYAGATAKDHHMSAAIDALHKRNANVINRASAGSTKFGRLGSSLAQVVSGEGSSEKIKREIESMETQKKALDAIAKRVTAKTATSDWTYGNARSAKSVINGVDSSGNSIDLRRLEFNFKSVSDAIDATPVGNDVVIESRQGEKYTVDSRTVRILRDSIKDSNEADYFIKVKMNQKSDDELQSLIIDAEKKGGARTNPSAPSVEINSRDQYTNVSGELSRGIRDKKRDNKIKEANDRFSGKK